MKKLLFPLVAAAFVVAGLGAYLFFERFAGQGVSVSDEKLVYEVKPGQTLTNVATQLESENLISSAKLFLLLARWQGDLNRLKVGEYELVRNMSPREILAVLTSGRSVGRNFTISEGLNVFEIADLIEAQQFGTRKEFLALVNDPQFVQELLGERQGSLEGYLFPETYQVTRYTDLKSIIRSMVARFMDVYRRDVEPLMAGASFSRHQMVTLASIIEKETGAPEEREVISSVFHNRLKKGMPLQTDPTVLYGKARKLGRMEIKIGRADLLAFDEYNTYRIKALPPGPIANPGRAALVASLRPASTEFLFFVSQNDGTHIFSKTYAEHNKAVRRYQLDPKAREGKSWRDLSKRQLDEGGPKR